MEFRVTEIPPERQNKSCAPSYTQVTGEGAGELHSPSAEGIWNICSGHLLKPHIPGGLETGPNQPRTASFYIPIFILGYLEKGTSVCFMQDSTKGSFSD